MSPEKRQLYRSSSDKMFAGVCGGIGEYADIDPIIVRVLWVILSLTHGIWLLAYILCAIIIPSEN